MWLFGDVWSSPAECHRLGELIKQGLDLEVASESYRAGLTEEPGGKVGACIQTLALIGFRQGHLGAVAIDLKNYGPNKTENISKFTGVGEELLKRATRWHLVCGLSAREIAERLLSA